MLQHFKLLIHLEEEFDLPMVIWGLWVKRLQSCWLSNFENDLTPGGLKPGPNMLAHISAGMAKVADFFFRTPNFTAGNSAAL